MRDKLKQFNVPEEYLNTDAWEPVEISNLSDSEKEIFLRKKNAIDLYLSTSLTIKTISDETNMSASKIYRLVERCLTQNGDGYIYGYSALLPYTRINSNRYNKFKEFIIQYPVLNELVIKRFKLHKFNQISNLQTIHRSFLRWCYKNNITDNEYPFTLSDRGYKALLRYYKEWSDIQDRLKALSQTTRLTLEQLPTSCGLPLSEVEVDGHRIDAYFITEFQTPSGTWREAIIERPWILCAIDRSTRCILGYELVLKPEYDSLDLISCIENSIIPTNRFSSEKDDKPKAFPNQIFSDIEYALFDELHLDNAKAHLSDSFLNTLVNKLGIKVCYGKVAEPTRRGIIERFFKTLEENSFHTLPSTTGSSPKDPRRHSPEMQAQKYRISVEDLENITFSTILHYNNTPHSSLYGNSPLEDFRQKKINKLFTYLPIPLRDGSELHTAKYSRKVVANGDNYLHLNFAGAKYTSSKLANDKSILGQTLLLQINLKDARVIKAFYSKGNYYDDLFVEKKWRGRKHSLKERRIITKLAREGHFSQLNQSNILESYDNYLFNKPTVDKKTASKIAEHLKETAPPLELKQQVKKSDNMSGEKEIDSLRAYRKLRGTPIEIKGLNL
ncbi:hypothetical protein HMPREF9422_0525 [Streptococcus cristatus ATCC 51100]|nr:DDE-type integrase/transposase/recombinase [Streptococcus cristatus]EFX53170.1 hypothetical protein HMPREF9422_0525 [Streptococcus cristatus ATCC 51100]KJQ57061.1 Integrase core domain protein [Streptococcus cristatus]SQG32268.1 Integrase core domain [Streptococcus cristatus ATCC 51100]